MQFEFNSDWLGVKVNSGDLYRVCTWLLYNFQSGAVKTSSLSRKKKTTEQIDDRVKPAAEAHFCTGSKRDHKLHQRRKKTRPSARTALLFPPLVFQMEIELSHVLANLEISVFATFLGVICFTCSVENTINFDSEFVSHLSLFRSIPNKLKLASPQERSFGTFFAGPRGGNFSFVGKPLNCLALFMFLSNCPSRRRRPFSAQLANLRRFLKKHDSILHFATFKKKLQIKKSKQNRCFANCKFS